MTTPLRLLALLLAASPLAIADDKPAPGARPLASHDISVANAEKLLKENPKVVVLDIRTPAEFAAGHIPGAKSIDFSAPDFAKQISALDRKTSYLIHCASGGRSGRAMAMPEVQALGNVLHMNEGFKAWEKAGKPVEK